jgi:hypothetical protein
MGARRHKHKGGHVDKKGKNNSNSTIMFIGVMFAPSLINLDSPIRHKQDKTSQRHYLKKGLHVLLPKKTFSYK